MTLVMPTRILIVGGGGREHALAWKLAAEPGVNSVVVAPGSSAMASLDRVTVRLGVDPLDPGAVIAVARELAAELVVIGPEAPLAAGIADALRAAGFPVFGPDRGAARIESSKAFCHEIAAAAGVRMARARAFEDAEAAMAFAAELTAGGQGVVVKADGLAAGKGVTVCDDLAAAEAAIRALAGDGRKGTGAGWSGGEPIVIVEERLVGPEASLIALCDGRVAVALPIARDHKRLLDGDRGPNTGGMGAYSPLPDLPDEMADDLLEAFHRPILRELAGRGLPFMGALYAGLILTADGPVLLECNARFGDPETQVLMPRLAVALGPLLLAAARGELARSMARLGIRAARLPAFPGAVVAIVVAAAGYPEAPRRGDPIGGLHEASSAALVFHAGTTVDGDGTVRTSGGRVLAVAVHGADLADAAAAADAAADLIHVAGSQRRHDIGRPNRVPLETAAGR